MMMRLPKNQLGITSTMMIDNTKKKIILPPPSFNCPKKFVPK